MSLSREAGLERGLGNSDHASIRPSIIILLHANERCASHSQLHHTSILPTIPATLLERTAHTSRNPDCFATNFQTTTATNTTQSSQPKRILSRLRIPTNPLPTRLLPLLLLLVTLSRDPHLLLAVLLRVEEGLAVCVAHGAHDVADGFEGCVEDLA